MRLRRHRYRKHSSGDITSLVCPDVNGVNGLNIGASGITVNGGNLSFFEQGFSTDEIAAGSGVYDSGYNNVVIKNLTVRGYNTGIFLKNVTGSTVQNITAQPGRNSRELGPYLS